MKTKRIIILIVALIFFLLIGTTITSAKVDPSDYKPTIGTEEAKEATQIGQKIIGTINVVGTVIFVVVIIVLGIKYMLGSIEEKSEYKKTMIPILVGAILLYGSTWIVKLIYTLVQTDI